MKRVYSIFMILVGVLIFAGVAYATAEHGAEVAEHVAEGAAAAGHAAGHGEHALFTSEKVWDFVYRMINLALFLGVIIYFAGAKIKGVLVGRRQQIKQDLDDLQTRQAGAEKKLKDVEASIANMAAEKEAILAEARKQGEVQKQAIIAKGVKDAEALKEQAKRTAENEAKAAIDTIRAEMADMVVAAAEKIVQEKLSQSDHDKLVDDYLTKVVLN